MALVALGIKTTWVELAAINLSRNQAKTSGRLRGGRRRQMGSLMSICRDEETGRIGPRGGDRSTPFPGTSPAASAAGKFGIISLISGCGRLGTCGVGLDGSSSLLRVKSSDTASITAVYPQQLGYKCGGLA